MPNTYIDPKRCIKQVWGQSQWRSHQCNFRRKEGTEYCTIHNPERVAAKDAARSEKWDREFKREAAQRKYGWAGNKLKQALVEARQQLENGADRVAVSRFIASTLEELE